MEHLPQLWIDWCAATGTSIETDDAATIERFARMAQPSRDVLVALCARTSGQAVERTAPAWPVILHDDQQALARTLRNGTASVQLAGPDWQHRVRLRRLLAIAVLIAPVQLGGAALSRSEVSGLMPPRLAEIREQLGCHDDPASCPQCILWSWLQVLGMNRHWSRTAVREHESFPDRLDEPQHRHELEDPEPDWMLWSREASLVPAMDRHGYLELHASLHPSSLSVVIARIADLGARAPAQQIPDGRRLGRAASPTVSAARECEILAEADALNARMARIFSSLS